MLVPFPELLDSRWNTDLFLFTFTCCLIPYRAICFRTLNLTPYSVSCPLVGVTSSSDLMVTGPSVFILTRDVRLLFIQTFSFLSFGFLFLRVCSSCFHFFVENSLGVFFLDKKKKPESFFFFFFISFFFGFYVFLCFFFFYFFFFF